MKFPRRHTHTQTNTDKHNPTHIHTPMHTHPHPRVLAVRNRREGLGRVSCKAVVC